MRDILCFLWIWVMIFQCNFQVCRFYTHISNKSVEFCTRFRLFKSQFIRPGPNFKQVFWIDKNMTFTEESRDDNQEPVYCFPFKLEMGSSSNCWTLTVERWAYDIDNSSIVHLKLNQYEEEFYPGEYKIDDNGLLQIDCLSGTFTNCYKGGKFLKLNFKYNNVTRTAPSNISFFQGRFNSSIYQIKKDYLLTCFNTSKPLRIKCPYQIRLTAEEFFQYSNNSIYVKKTKEILKPTDYEIVHREVIICIDEPKSKYSMHTFNFHGEYQGILTLVCLTISLICLFIHIIFSVVYSDYKTFAGKILLSLVISLLSAQLLFLLHSVFYYNEIACLVFGCLLHYGFLANFCWMGIVAFNMWRMLHDTRVHTQSKDDDKQWFLLYSLCGWLIPLIFVMTTLLINYYSENEEWHANYVKGDCWISNFLPLTAFFLCPLGIIVVMNIIFFFLTSLSIFRTSLSLKHVNKSRNDHYRFAIYWKLAIIMGLGWISFLTVTFTDSIILRYVFIIVNAPQGLFIFLCFTCIQKTRKRTGVIFSRLSSRKSENSSSSFKYRKNSQNTVRTSFSPEK